MTITTTIIYDGPDRQDIKEVDDVARCTTYRTIWKAGTPAFNQAALQTVAANAIATLNTAESLLQAGGPAWDNATPAQRSALMLALVRQNRALIRLAINALDQPS